MRKLFMFLILLAIMFMIAGPSWAIDTSGALPQETVAIGIPPDLMVTSSPLMATIYDFGSACPGEVINLAPLDGTSNITDNEVIWPDHAVARIRSGTMVV